MRPGIIEEFIAWSWGSFRAKLGFILRKGHVGLVTGWQALRTQPWRPARGVIIGRPGENRRSITFSWKE